MSNSPEIATNKTDYTSLGEISTALEAMAKLGAVIIAMLYVVGLLISNEYLTTLGLTDFSLLRVKCVFTGAWAVPMIFVASLPALTLWIFEPFAEFRKRYKTLAPALSGWCFLFGFIELLAIFVSVFANSYLLKLMSPSHNSAEAVCKIEKDILFGLVIVGMLLSVRARRNVLLGVLSAVAVIGAFSGLATQVYPLVGEEFGGGAPVAMKIAFARDAPDFLLC
jgi:hypothetical protein